MQSPFGNFRGRRIIRWAGRRKHTTGMGVKTIRATEFLQSVRIICVIISITLLAREANFIIPFIYIKSEKFQHLFLQIFLLTIFGN